MTNNHAAPLGGMMTRAAGSPLRQTMVDAGMVPGITVRSITNPVVGNPEAIRWFLATENPVTVYDWQRDALVQEVLLMDGMVLPDNGQVPLLDCHNRWSCESQLGSVADFQAAMNGEVRALDGLLRFAADEPAQRIRQKVLDGHLTDGSAGYRVLKSLWIPEGTTAVIRGRSFDGPVKVSTAWSIREFSLTPIGADSLAKKRTVGLRSQASRLAHPGNHAGLQGRGNRAHQPGEVL